MTENLQSELRPHLQPGESLLWTGQPKSGLVFRGTDALMIPFSLLWLGFVVFWMIMAARGSAMFALFAIPFLLVGLYALIGRFIVDARVRSHTTYGITENRIIIKSGVFSKTIKSLNLKTISDIELSERSDRSGTITIGPKTPSVYWGSSMEWWPGLPQTPQLQLIPDARKVYSQIIELQQKH